MLLNVSAIATAMCMLYSIGMSAQEVKSAAARQVRLEPRTAGLKQYPVNKVFSSIEYIALETNTKSFFGKIDQLELTDKLMFVLDINFSTTNLEPHSAILAFDHQGKFKFRIDNYYISSFSLNPAKEELSFVHDNSNTRIYYNFQGKFLRKELLPFFAVDWYELFGNTYYYRGYYTEGDWAIQNPELSQWNLHLQSSTGESKYRAMKFDPQILQARDVIGPKKYFYSDGQHTFISGAFSYKIYKVQADELQESYQFIFPADRSLPNDFISNPSFTNKRLSYLTKNKHTFFQISNFYECGQNLLFQLTCMSANDQGYIFNLESQNLVALNTIVIDSDNTSFPGLRKVDASFNGSHYSGFSAMSLKAEQYRQISANQKSKNILRDQKRSNPIIMKFKLRDNI